MSHTHTHDCRTMLAEMSDYIDGELSENLCAELEKHLQTCENCTIVVNTLRKTIDLYQHTQPDPSDTEAVSRRLVLRLQMDNLLPED
jgi:anti-sigma factor RsiW